MASSSAKLVSRLSSIALKFNSKPASLTTASLLKSASKSAINKRIISRLPVELSSSLDSMMPLHNAIASARLQSSLSAESQRWGLVIQVLQTKVYWPKGVFANTVNSFENHLFSKAVSRCLYSAAL